MSNTIPFPQEELERRLSKVSGILDANNLD